MDTTSFLNKIAKEYFSNYTHNNAVIVLPNKRAKVFLLNEIKKHSDKPLFAPIIINIEDLIQEIAGIRSIDTLTLLFEFYEVYLTITPISKQQNFEDFSYWAKTLLQDFNEIDRYLLDPNHVFTYLKDIEALKRWNLEAQNTTEWIDNQFEFWNQLPNYYKELYAHLVKNKIGYQGLIYREAVNNITEFSKSNKSFTYIFAGFNALNQAEEKIIQFLLAQAQAKIYWDIDEVFLNDVYHDAGLFTRNFKSNWKYYNSNPFEWIANDFKASKSIEIIGTPKSVGQTKIAAKITEEIAAKGDLNKTAIVLGDENLLLPLLHQLPNNIDDLNITMGYSGKYNPAQTLIAKLFKMHTNAINRNEKQYTFYHKEVKDVINHPLVAPFLNLEKLVYKINNQNFTFFSQTLLYKIKEECYSNLENVFFDLLFLPWNTISTDEIINRLTSILFTIKENLGSDTETDKVSKAFVYSIYKALIQTQNYQEKYKRVTTVDTLHSIYKQLVSFSEVSFEGKPLNGLQIMGVLESRVLDFENVIITSVNEGKFPGGKQQNSFIPYDVKRELGLPTFKEKDAIYTYHFYHLLQRAKNIYLLYNTDKEGLDAGEKSRFIRQLEVEKHYNHSLTHRIYNAASVSSSTSQKSITKTEAILDRLQEIATVKGFSPSSLISYIRNPYDFYLQRILRVRDVDEVEENIAANTLGTIIHKVLENLYCPYINRVLLVQDCLAMEKEIEGETQKEFKNTFKEGTVNKGKNLLAFEVAKRHVYNFIQQEKKQLEKGDEIIVHYLEKNLEYTLEDSRLPYAIKIAGNADRIESRNGVIQIIDYKTGKVEPKNLKIKELSEIALDYKYNKVFQIICYLLLFQNDPLNLNRDISAGIISFKNLKTGYMPFEVFDSKQKISSPEILEEFKNSLVNLLLEILNPALPFDDIL